MRTSNWTKSWEIDGRRKCWREPHFSLFSLCFDGPNSWMRRALISVILERSVPPRFSLVHPLLTASDHPFLVASLFGHAKEVTPRWSTFIALSKSGHKTRPVQRIIILGFKPRLDPLIRSLVFSCRYVLSKITSTRSSKALWTGISLPRPANQRNGLFCSHSNPFWLSYIETHFHICIIS